MINDSHIIINFKRFVNLHILKENETNQHLIKETRKQYFESISNLTEQEFRIYVCNEGSVMIDKYNLDSNTEKIENILQMNKTIGVRENLTYAQIKGKTMHH